MPVMSNVDKIGYFGNQRMPNGSVIKQHSVGQKPQKNKF
jgi:hypothetical protein